MFNPSRTTIACAIQRHTSNRKRGDPDWLTALPPIAVFALCGVGLLAAGVPPA